MAGLRRVRRARQQLRADWEACEEDSSGDSSDIWLAGGGRAGYQLTRSLPAVGPVRRVG